MVKVGDKLYYRASKYTFGGFLVVTKLGTKYIYADSGGHTYGLIPKGSDVFVNKDDIYTMYYTKKALEKSDLLDDLNKAFRNIGNTRLSPDASIADIEDLEARLILISEQLKSLKSLGLTLVQ